MVDMGRKLKLLRVQNRMTQKQVADRLGLAVSAVSSYESGLRYPTYATLVKLATMYRTSCDYLVGMSGQKTINVTDLSDTEIEVLMQTIEIFRQKHT